MEGLRSQYDAANGGFGSAPKFPPASALEFLLRRGEVEMVAHTLRAMASGGMYDQIGGGFARYSVDPHWLVPHFEKMLYDNALLARAYLHGWQVTGDPLFRRVAEETLDWALREMRAPEGGFFSALDADSEGVEGKFYVWSVDELRAALGDEPDADEAIAWFGATDRGNFEGANIPVRGPGTPERPRRLAPAPLRGARRARLAGARRQAPDLLERADDLGARRGRRGARAARLPRCGGAAPPTSCSARCATRTAACCAPGRTAAAALNAYLEDHAFLLEALLTLYESSFEPRWFAEARALADTMIERFGDERARRLLRDLVRPRAPAGPPQGPRGPPDPVRQRQRRATACCAWPRSPASTRYEDRAVGVLRLLHELAAQHPQAFGHLLQALDFHLAPVQGGGAGRRRPRSALERVVRGAFRPHLVLAGGAADGVPLLQDRPPVDGRAGRLRVRALRLQGARDRARGARTAALLAILGARARRRLTTSRCASPPGARARRRAPAEAQAHRLMARTFRARRPARGGAGASRCRAAGARAT